MTRKDIKNIEKYCLYCSKRLERKRYNGRLEDFGVFSRRKFCNSECMAKYWLIQPNPDADFRTAHTTARKINKKILKRTSCEICGKTGRLDVHHINQNWKDNSLENLQVLCRQCHMKIHTNKQTCTLCGKPMKGHGYCEKHYIRYKKYGCPLRMKKMKKCENCSKTKEDQSKCLETDI